MESKNKNDGDSSSLPKLIGLSTVVIFFIFGVVSLVISGVDFQILHTKWAEGPWTDLAPVSFACTIHVVLSSLIGFGIFTVCYTQKILILVYAIVILLSLLFSWAIGIFASIGGTIYHKIDGIIGCNTELTGVLEMWKNVDIYLMYADSLLCSDFCSCPFNKDVRSEFQENYFAKSSFDNWETYELEQWKNEDNEFIEKTPTFNFRNCSKPVQLEAHRRYIEHPNSTEHWIDPEKFASYWKTLENRFNCTGWCKTKYTDPYTSQEKRMYKFIFSNINQGVVAYPGCLHRITNWLPSLLGTIGGCLIVCAFAQTISFIMALKLYGSPVDYSKSNVNPEKA